MIPVSENRELVSSKTDAKDSASFGISETDSAHVMTILRDTLYSDKIMAVLREYASNAWDANRMAGKGDVPIKVVLPTLQDPSLKIRDFGTGLSSDDVFKVYTQYGASTKRDDNAAVGMLGIGSKSGFAYSDSFTVTSWHNGLKRTYVAVIDSSEKGRINFLFEEPCGEETGLQIEIPVKGADNQDFENKAKTLFVHFRPQPDINTTLPIIIDGQSVDNLGSIIDTSNDYNLRGKWWAIMGCVPYRINLDQLNGVYNGDTLHKCARSISGYLKVEIGDLTVAASREDLKYSDTTKLALVNKINNIIDQYVANMLAGIDKLSLWEQRLSVIAIDRMGLSPGKALANLKKFQDAYITLTASRNASVDGSLGYTPVFAKFSTKQYNGKFSETSSFRVDKELRFVIRDDKRAIGGYTTLKNTDVVVTYSPAIQAVKSKDPVHDAKVYLKKIIIEKEMTGVTVINMSTLPWSVQASTNGPQPRDALRAKSKCFIFNPTIRSIDAKSKNWDPADRIALSTDVYVILESYADVDQDDFYDKYAQDKSKVTGLGLTMPAVIGYKSTKAFPVDRAKLKGVSYKNWRNDGLTKLLMSYPGMADLIQAMGWAERSESWRKFDEATMNEIIHNLGANHIITKFVKEEIKSYDDISMKKSTAAMHAAAKFIVKRTTDIVLNYKEKLNEIELMYPLLAYHKVDILKMVDQRKLWLDYIMVIDNNNTYLKNQNKKEEAA